MMVQDVTPVPTTYVFQVSLTSAELDELGKQVKLLIGPFTDRTRLLQDLVYSIRGALMDEPSDG